MDQRIIKQIEKYISPPQPVLICSHRDPDGDSIGCQLAFYDFLRQRRKGIVVSNDGELPAKYQFLDRRGIIKQPGKIKPRPWSAAVIFECSNLDRIGRVQGLLAPDTPLINIDHHDGNQRFGTVNWVDKDASACGEMVYQLVRKLDGRITQWPAELLLTSIITDTGRFHYRSTRPRTMRIVAELMEAGADLKKLTDRLFFSFPEAQFRFVNRILDRADIREDGRICLLKVRRRDALKYGVLYRDLEGLADCTLTLADVKIGALLKEMKKGWTKISLRSTGRLSIVPVARHFSGGGHPNAAGCQIDKPLDQAVEELADVAVRYLQNGKLWNSPRA
ncbi:bifunctional oligoribonuclease/PAP phosphatase NrnA [Candidatus Zixiibacteriota bacterium]